MRLTQRRLNRKKTNGMIITGTNNAVKCSKNIRTEGLSHRITKFWIAEYCWEQGLDFATEVTMKGGRADIVIKDWCIAIEILSSETIKDFIKKKYPIPTIPVRSTESIGSIISMLRELESTDGTAWDYYLKRNINEINKSEKGPRQLYKSVEDLIKQEGT